MARSRKDNKGRILKKGESQRKSDLMYVYTYRDPMTQKRRYVYSKDLMQLREKEKILLRNQMDGINIYAAGKTDLNQVFDRYISTKVELRNSTRYNYIYLYDYFIRDTFGKKKIGEIKYSDVLFFYLNLLTERKIKISTLQTIHVVLHPAFQMAVRDNIIRTNPSDGVMQQIRKKTGQTNGTRQALTVEQQKAFMDYVANSPFFCRYTPLFTVLLGTGCRIGEIIGLRWSDIDFENRMISINHSMIYYPKMAKESKCVYQIAQPKTKSGIRNVPMMEAVYKAFKDEAAMQEEDGIRSTMTVDGMSGFVFCNRQGRLYYSCLINKIIRQIVQAYNSEEEKRAIQEERKPIISPIFTCHHLRHTFCARFCENESNIKVIQTVMGHSDIKTTMNIYAEVTDKKKKEAIENLSRNLHIF